MQDAQVRGKAGGRVDIGCVAGTRSEGGQMERDLIPASSQISGEMPPVHYTSDVQECRTRRRLEISNSLPQLNILSGGLELKKACPAPHKECLQIETQRATSSKTVWTWNRGKWTGDFKLQELGPRGCRQVFTRWMLGGRDG
eukprot:750636-Hanusia_phi.AAC.10